MLVMVSLIQPTFSAIDGSPFRYVGLVLLAITVFMVAKQIVDLLTSPLRSVPGPLLARFTRLWESYIVEKYDHATYNIALHKRYGPVVRLAPNRYSIDDAEATKFILGFQNALDKSDYYQSFGSPTLPTIFTTQSIPQHAKLRRPITQLYTNASLLSYEPFVETCNSILLKQLAEYADQGKVVDVRQVMQYYAFDVIGEMTVGSRFGLMENNGDRLGILASIDDVMIYAARFGLVPELANAIFHLATFSGMKSPLAHIEKFINDRIDDRTSGRTKSPSDRKDFLNKALTLEQEGKSNRFDTYNVCVGNIAAGSDTTAISLAATLAYLSMNPRVNARLRQELDDTASAGMLSEPVSFKEAQKLPYLQAVIKESLRIHPAVGAPLTRMIGKDGAYLSGYHFPSGTEVGVNPWVVHHNKDIFGPDAADFNPDRWLVDDVEKRSLMDRNMIAFGAGPRTCIGKNISLLEMSKVIPQIVRRFDFEIVPDATTGEGYSWKTYWFTKQNLKCRIKARST